MKVGDKRKKQDEQADFFSDGKQVDNLGKVGFIFAHSQHSHISAFNNVVNLHQKRLISVSYHYRLL